MCADQGLGVGSPRECVSDWRKCTILAGPATWGPSIHEASYYRFALLSSIAVGVLGMCASQTQAQGPTRHRLSEAGTAALSRQLDAAVARGDTPGVVGLVVDRNGVLYEGSAGKLDVARNLPMVPDAIFRIASMTKPITSVAIMMLLEEEKLRLDDPVFRYLPGFEDLRVIKAFNATDGSYETRPAKRPMTIRHFLTHTSGIGYGFSSPEFLYFTSCRW
jgi:methyl acetate hydrolase